MELIQTALAFVVTLGILVTIHEYGHFWVARRCGVKVLRFSVGFGMPLWRRVGRDGTEYVVAAIPLGGYVKMLDGREGDVPESQRHMAFDHKSVWQRIAIVAAGPLVNLIFAVFAYWLLYLVGITSIAAVIGKLEPGTPAETVGLPLQSEIVAVDGQQVYSWGGVNLHLASRIGDQGTVSMSLLTPGNSEPRQWQVPISDWQVDLETQSPAAALGVRPAAPDVPAIIGRVVEGGRAQVAGLQAGDKVLAIDGQPIEQWLQLVEFVRAAPGRELNFAIERQASQLELFVTPDSRVTEQGSIGFIGAGNLPYEWPEQMKRTQHYGPLDSLIAAVDRTWQMISLTLESIWKMLEGIISVKNLSGPITIAKVAGASAASGFESFISFLAYLSISLGVLNLLPIPMLDGGHLLYYVIEAVRGKPVSERVQLLGVKLGLTLLLSVMAVAVFNDIMRL